MLGKVFIFAIFFLLASCAPTKEPSRPEDASLNDVAVQEEDPRVAASLRTVEKGRSLFDQGRTQRSISLFLQALELDSGNAHAYLFLGRARLKKGAASEAVEDFSKALDLFEKDDFWKAWAFLERARAREMLGEVQMAEEDAQKALAVAPAWPAPGRFLRDLKEKHPE